MDPAKAQVYCQVGILLSAIFLAIFTYGNHHFGRRKDEKAKASQILSDERGKKEAAQVFTKLEQALPRDGAWFREVVASIYQRFAKNATVTINASVPSPDGIRRADIWISGKRGGVERKALVMCIDSPAGNPVDIDKVDSIDSLRTDLQADDAVICSLSGYTDKALIKAKRRNIGMLGVIKRNDGRILTAVELPVISELFTANKVEVKFSLPTETAKTMTGIIPLREIIFDGKYVQNWVAVEVRNLAHSASEGKIPTRVVYVFRQPLVFRWGVTSFPCTGITIHVDAEIGWYLNKTAIEVDSGFFDHLNGAVLFTNSDSMRIISSPIEAWIPVEPPLSETRQYASLPVDQTKELPIGIRAAKNIPFRDKSAPPDLSPFIASRTVQE